MAEEAILKEIIWRANINTFFEKILDLNYYLFVGKIT